jgi:hypothetical protein
MSTRVLFFQISQVGLVLRIPKGLAINGDINVFQNKIDCQNRCNN